MNVGDFQSQIIITVKINQNSFSVCQKRKEIIITSFILIASGEEKIA